MNTLDTIKSTVNDAEVLARKVWLAGIGAYGKSVDEMQGRYEQINTEANKLFEDLVSKGEKLESDAKVKFADTKGKIKASANIDQRVADVRAKLGLDKEESEDKIAELSAKVDALTDVIAKLSAK